MKKGMGKNGRESVCVQQKHEEVQEKAEADAQEASKESGRRRECAGGRERGRVGERREGREKRNHHFLHFDANFSPNWRPQPHSWEPLRL